MVLTVLGFPQSVCTRRVLMTLEELKIPYAIEFIDVMLEAHKSTSYMTKQPFGKVPVIVDEDGLVLFESRAISRYLVTKTADRSLSPHPNSTQNLASFEEALSVEVTAWDPVVKDLIDEILFKKFRGEIPDESRVKVLRNRLESVLDVYENVLLKDKDYLSGNNFTLVDLFHLSYGELLFVAGEGSFIENRRNVSLWWKRIHNRPAWQKVLTLG